MLGSTHRLIISGGFKEAGTAQMVMRIVGSDEAQEFILAEYCNNHIEADSMVWLHASNCLHANAPVVIFSTDTDIPHVGLPLVRKYPNRHFIVQLRESAGKTLYLDLKKLHALMENDTDLRVLIKSNIALELQALFVCTGCDYVSFFNHYSKLTFYGAYFDNVGFISADSSFTGSLSQTGTQDWLKGFRAFCRLVGCVFIKKCARLFQHKMQFSKLPTPKEIYSKISEENPASSEPDLLLEWLHQIRQFVMRAEGCTSEDFWLPSNDSLILHWKRSCYVLQIWKQTDVANIVYPIITEWGWSYVNDTDLVF